MSFHYTVEMAIDEIKSKIILSNPEIKKIAKKHSTEIKYEDGTLTLTCAENEDLDEELVKKILSLIKTKVKAKAYLYDGKSKIEIFSGKLDPKNPFGQSKEDIKERTIESIEEEEFSNGISLDDFDSYDAFDEE
ncbi:hypothetical protein JYK00_07685 [Thermosipho ferrireducens]|uniref:Uncharacterized protein n=1 Tax=Thermosipho ferrireducens TaxID=2571116 RepID=A0ABX7S600_9BACT|nr:hypothetical protein [Thermosipho ferrireducens]QTA37604.1 hypothetical protein JYK00_07685 [Thermosipho ferrireducens]